MKNKKNRLQKIIEIISNSKVGCQDLLLKLLHDNGYELTQATLSRDLKRLKVAKLPTEEGAYVYILPKETQPAQTEKVKNSSPLLAGSGFLSIEFSGNLAVIKTRPGYAGGIASDIDTENSNAFLGSIAGDDTILLIIRENISREKVIEVLRQIIPTINNGK